MITRFVTRASYLLFLLLISIAGKAQLSARFSATNIAGCAPLLVNFTDQSTGNPTQWKWDLGNGTISFLQNPSVSYFNPGFYTIKLVVTNASGKDSIIKSQYINVSAKPVVQFSSPVTRGCYPLSVAFTDQSLPGTDTIQTWQWDFGDGFSSSLKNPVHIYKTAGNFNVTLRVINSKGCLNTLSKSEYITVNNGPKADFSNSVPNVCSAPVTINFNNLSTGTGALSYLWDFGDGDSSIQQNPSHIYSLPGSYTVRLVVTNATGCTDTITKSNAFSVGNVFPAIKGNAVACVGSALIISDSSTPTPSSVTWYFGDGTTSTEINPSKQYTTPGTYQVKMVANFGSCIDSAFKTVTVLPKPNARFTNTDSSSCSNPFTVNFNQQALNATGYLWDFGDNTSSTLANPAHTYTNYGTYTVSLTVTSANGCTDIFTKTNLINIIRPTISFSNLPDSGCVPFTKKFVAATTSVDAVVSYLWNFGDGATSTSISPTHTYTTQGAFDVTLVIRTAGGCSDTAVISRGVVTNTKPVAAFSALPREACARFPVVFRDESTGNPTRWYWTFGDGNTSISRNPEHIYSDTGYYDITLVVWNSGCQDTLRMTDYIHVNPPIARYEESFDCTRPLERTFTNTSVGADEWLWDFGDGSTSTQQHPTHTFALPGDYSVGLTVRNHASGCDFTTVKTIRVVNVKAGFYASDTIICKGNSLLFNTNLSLTAVANFQWDFGDGQPLHSTTANSTSHLYTSSGNFTVRLITTDILGCQDTITKPTYIRIDGPTAVFTPSVPGTCLNNLVSFNDASYSDSVHPIQTWTWKYGDGTTQTMTTPSTSHLYTTPGAYTVNLKVTDSKGCTDSVNIAMPVVISKPEAKFALLDSVSCPTKEVRFSNQSTGPGLTYLWNFGDGTTSVDQHPVHNYAADGTYTISLAIRDQYGCTDSVTRATAISIVTPVADFSMSDSFSICPPLIVQFTNNSQHAVAHNWDFGDGTGASIAQPSHFYNYPGTYTVTLTVTANGGCQSIMKKDIVVNGPKGTFTYNPTNGCNPVTVNFVAQTKDRISFIWDFNDGATVSTLDSVVSHTYTNPGIYLPKMILFDANGCQVPITGTDTIIVNGITARFSFVDKPVCDNGTVTFTNTSVSNDIITGYQWFFGNGQGSTDENPQFNYDATGQFYPKLVVTTLHGCKDSMQSAIPVKVVRSPVISMTTTANGCTPLAATFRGVVNIPDTSALSWYWNFGNGLTSLIQDPAVQNFTTAGVFNPYVIATNSSGCSDTATRSIEAFGIPLVNAGADTTTCNKGGVQLAATGASSYTWSPAAGLSCTTCPSPMALPDSSRKYIVSGTSAQGCVGTDTVLVKVQYAFKIKYSSPDTLCKGQSVKLFASGTDNFEWWPSTGLNNTNTAVPIGMPDTSITYRVIGTDKFGCFKDTGYVPVTVYPIPSVNAGADQTINVGQSTDLVPVISPDVNSVIWSPTGSIFRNTYPAISVQPNQNTEFTVEVKNRGGCMARDKVNVIVLCNGANVFIPNTFSPNGDGANDIFYPRGNGLFKIKSMRLFNRWGEKVFERSSFDANSPAAGWDGTFKGAKLPADVFVYMIDIICDNNTVLTHKGNVALLQ